MSGNRSSRRRLLGATALAGALSMFVAGQALAESAPIQFDQPAQPLAQALRSYSAVADQEIMFADALVAGRTAPPLKGAYTPEGALMALLDGTGLTVSRTNSGVLLVQGASDPQSGSAAGDGAEGTVQALIVTAQKREENIQDVPIAMSAFTQEDLTKSQVAGGPDLMTQIPNFTFTKTNFTGYSIQIRGIGTQAISATTDPAVAVAFNNTPFIRNRFFEQEFYDLERVEVLRGPQGTLYGRNATAGVVNVISAKPKNHFEAKLSADVANYSSTRLEGMLNIPIVADKAALRLAGAWTKRDGYAVNRITGNAIDGRNLWSTRLSLGLTPSDHVSANLIWEHFEEDDDRLRSGKQLCHKDNPTEIAGVPMPAENQPGIVGSPIGTYSQGCRPASLYAPESYETPNGFSLPYYAPLGQLGVPTVRYFDPYASRTQSRDLRVIESTWDPHYKARNDVVETQIKFDINDKLTVVSETAYSSDWLRSIEDYNRFNTAHGAFHDNTGGGLRPGVLNQNGEICDPQLGCSDRVVLVDMSTAKSRQFSQEFRLSSDFDGPVNFSAGINFLRYDTEDKYYVFVNTLTSLAISYAEAHILPSYVNGVSDNSGCLVRGLLPGDPNKFYTIGDCIYIDPNPLMSVNDQGHNYFLSRNPYKLISYAAFGEAYVKLAPDLKLTAGLRWTVDKKQAPQIPSWLVIGHSYGYPVAAVYNKTWREPTGRLTLDWRPSLSATDDTLIYASFARGYKAGGANPPPPVEVGYSFDAPAAQGIIANSLSHPRSFKAEYVNAYEVGTKNTLADGAITLDGDAFYYDYQGYQISQIVDRSAINLNFDAQIWGAELEAAWRPTEALRFNLKVGYEDTRLKNGSSAIDLMDRTAGDPNWVVSRPFPSIPSNCILPAWLVTWKGRVNTGAGSLGNDTGMCTYAYAMHVDPVTALPYVPYPTEFAAGQVHNGPYWDGYPGFDPTTTPNNGEGIAKDLSGNQLPNAPHITTTISADYTLPLPNDWLVTLHGDFYHQSEAWARVFNTPGYDKLKAYTNLNLAAIFSNEDAGWKVMAYVKNVFDKDNITGAFLNSDDTGLTTNVFLNEPRLYGLRVTKEWNGEAPWGASWSHPAGSSFPLTLELAGAVERVDVPNSLISPDFIHSFSADIDPRSAQNRNLDWGDERKVKMTYAGGGNWKLSASLRYGKVNSTDNFFSQKNAKGGCLAAAIICEIRPDFYRIPVDYGRGLVHNDEKHTFADFMVGRDANIGGWVKSALDFGIAYGDLQSKTEASMNGIPNVVIAEEFAAFSPATHDRYNSMSDAERQFKGAGPKLAWEASSSILGSDSKGHVNADWSISGAVLFGKQKTRTTGDITDEYFNESYAVELFDPWPPTSIFHDTVNLTRSKSATVPVLGASAGLSYEVGRLKVSTGYQWERYFNAIDGGYDTHKSYDRTFDGPYFKVSVGFGG